MLMTNRKNNDKNLYRNAIIEGLWALLTFAVGAGAVGLRGDPLAWLYGSLLAFGIGSVGYLMKEIGLKKGNNDEKKA